jgi:hypothetical protein
MDHHFNTEIATKYGVNAAILLHNITYWIAKNRSENRHFHDGRYWTYMSKAGLSELFPYLSAKQIDYALNKLVDAGLIITGNYNQNTFDKTKWYALAEPDEGEKCPETAQLPITTKGSNRLDKREQSISTKGSNRIPQKGVIDADKREQSINSNIYNNIYNTNKKHTDNNPDKKQANTVDDVINTIDDSELRAELWEFVRMRKSIKKPPTPYALELIISQLTKMSQDKLTRIAILRQSIKNCWQGLYPLKDPPPGTESDGNEMTPTENISDIEKQFMSCYE